MLALHQARNLSRVYSARRTMVAGIGSKPHPPNAHQFDLIFNDVSFKDGLFSFNDCCSLN